MIDMHHLSHVPDELLLIIFSGCNANDLAQLSRVNRRFQILAEPYLYKHIEWLSTDTADPPIYLFLRSILARPALATHVKHAILQGDSFRVPRLNAAHAERVSPTLAILPTDEDVRRLVSIVQGSDLPLVDRDSWASDVERGTMDAVLSVLLSQLPNTQVLRLDRNFTKDATIMSKVLTYAFCNPSCNSPEKLQSLRRVDLNFHFWTETWRTRLVPRLASDLAFIGPFLHAPSIEHLSAVIEEPYTSDWIKKLPEASSLRSLQLSVLREKSLGEILRCCPRLDSLEYLWYADKKCELPPSFLHCVDLAQSLDHISLTLRYLKLSVEFQPSDSADEGWQAPFGIDGTVTTLPKFALLEDLEIPFILLLGLHPSSTKLSCVLPPNLRRLILSDELAQLEEGTWDNTESLLKVVEDWLESWKNTTPYLVILDMSLQQAHHYMREEDFPALRQRYDDLGLRYEMDMEVTGGAWPGEEEA